MKQSEQPVRTFTAFISYKRGEDDEKYAKWLQAKLESFRIPTEIAPAASGDIANRRFRIFRDKTDLGSHAELREGLHKSLEQCRYLIVVCSPRSATSPYVDAEVRWFQENGRADAVIPFIISGTPAPREGEEQCYPPSLGAEALGITLAEGSREEALIKIVARLLRVDFHALYQRHLRAQRRFMMKVAVGLTLVLALVAGLAVWAVNAERRATAQRKEAEGLVRFLTFDLRDEAFNYIPIKAREKITDKVEDYYRKWGESTLESRYYRAMHLSNQAGISLDSGYGAKATEQAEQALDLLDGLRRELPDDAELAYARVEAGVVRLLTAGFMLEKGRALPSVDAMLEDALALVKAAPESARAKKLLIMTLRAAAQPLLVAGNAPEAQRLQEQAVRLAREGTGAAPGDTEYLFLTAAAEGELCRLKIASRQDGLAHCAEAVSIAEGWVRADPHNHEAQQCLISALDTQLHAQTRTGRLEEALNTAATVLPMHEAARASDPDNLIWRLRRMRGLLLRVECVERMRREADYAASPVILKEAESLVELGIAAFSFNLLLFDLRDALSQAENFYRSRRADTQTLKELAAEAETARAKRQKALAAAGGNFLKERFAHLDLLNALNTIGFQLAGTGHFSEALPYFAEGAELHRQCRKNPQVASDPSFGAGLVHTLGEYASVAKEAGNVALAERLFAEGEALATELLRLDPKRLETHRAIAGLYDAKGFLGLALGDSIRAKTAFAQALAHCDTVLSLPGSGVQDAQAQLRAREKMAVTLDEAGLYAEAETFYSLMLPQAREARQNPAAANYQAEPLVLGLQLSYYAHHLAAIGNTAEAERIMAAAETAAAAPPLIPMFRQGWRWIHLSLLSLKARLLLDAGRPEEALSLISRCLAFDGMSPQDTATMTQGLPPASNWYCQLAEALLAAGRLKEAETALEAGRFTLATRPSTSLDMHDALCAAEYQRLEARLALARKNPAAARAALEAAQAAMAAHAAKLASLRNLTPAEAEAAITNPDWAYARAGLLLLAGDVESAQGRLETALEQYRQGVQKAETLTALEPRQPRWRALLAEGLRSLADCCARTGRAEDAATARKRAAGLTVMVH